MHKKKTKIKAILFDFDGTLVDSERIHYNVWNEVMIQYDLPMDYNTYLKEAAGIPSLEYAKLTTAKYGLAVTAETMVGMAKSIYSERLDSFTIDVMPHAIETLQYFYKRNFPMALVTGSTRSQVEPVLKEKDFKKYFKTTITYDDVARSKPDPEGYLKAVVSLGLPKEEYLVFEDTANGTRAAKAAGLTCYAIQSEVGLHQNLTHADKIFLDLDEAMEFLKKEGLI